MTDPLFSLSPLDGRYHAVGEALSPYCSEAALIRTRLYVEIEWLIHLCNEVRLEGTRALNKDEILWLRRHVTSFGKKSAQAVKKIEATTNHDVKAVEYFLKERMEKHTTKNLAEFVHFACTSEDINNLAYGIMFRDAVQEVLIPALHELHTALKKLAKIGAAVPMLAHTHGQPASPTTVGKEIMNVILRLTMQMDELEDQTHHGKMNGAVGNWNAHAIAYPEVDWIGASVQFIEKLELAPMLFTTQIEPHDGLAELSHTLIRLNTILLDLNRDLWMYIGKNYFTQSLKKGEVGSSTMPHKVNPIDFENSEGNLGIANALLAHFAEKLPVSRLQRDLTDSTVLRSVGTALGYSLLAYKSTLRGLAKIDINTTQLAADLDAHWEVLAEALQTVMRRYKIPKPYEKLKELTRGKGLTQKEYQKFVGTLKIPASEKKRLQKLTPATYTGYAQKLTESAL